METWSGIRAVCKPAFESSYPCTVIKQRSVRPIGLALLCLFCVVLPLITGPGPVHTRGGGDSPFCWFAWSSWSPGCAAGSLPVRWMPDAAYGLGYPFFNYYAALPYYIAAGLRLLGWGPIRALQATQALGFVLAAVAMALLARRTMRHPAAVALAAVAYTCAPFHLVNVYVRGDSLSEFYAFVFYPLILWALLRLRDRPWPARVAWLALSYGGLILTHNLSAVMFSPFVAAFALWALFVPAPDAQGSRETAATADARARATRMPSARAAHALARAGCGCLGGASWGWPWPRPCGGRRQPSWTRCGWASRTSRPPAFLTMPGIFAHCSVVKRAAPRTTRPVV